MAKIKITYTAPVPADAANVSPICPVFEPENGYSKSEAFAGTVYAYAEGNGTWEGYPAYLDKISSHPGIIAMYKAATKGDVEFEVTDPMELQYYKELAAELAAEGFATEIDGETVEDGDDETKGEENKGEEGE